MSEKSDVDRRESFIDITLTFCKTTVAGAEYHRQKKYLNFIVMKKIILFVGAVVIATCTFLTTQASVDGGCGVSQCGGGNDKCCSQDGATYYIKAKQQ